MRSHIVFTLLILFTVSLNTESMAGLNLQQLWEIAGQQNLTLKQQEKNIARAETEIAIQTSAYYPSLSASGNGAWLHFNEAPALLRGQGKDLSLNVVGLNIDQTVFTGFRIRNAAGQARENFNVQSIQKNITRNQLYFEIGQAYYDIQSNQLQQKVLQESIDRLQNQLIKIRNMLEAKQVTPFDTLELSNKKLQIYTHLVALQGEINILTHNLHYLTNSSDLPPIDPMQNIAADITLSPIDDYFQTAWKNRPELRQIVAQKRSLDFTTGILEAAYYPTLAVSGAYNNARLKGAMFDGNWIDFYSVFLSFQWELWNWRRDARKVEQVRLDTDRLDLANQDLISRIRQQVITAYQILETNLQQINLGEQLVRQEKERYRQSHERYERGQITVLDLNTAENDLTTAELELQNTRIQWHKHKLQLDFATGIIGMNN